MHSHSEGVRTQHAHPLLYSSKKKKKKKKTKKETKKNTRETSPFDDHHIDRRHVGTTAFIPEAKRRRRRRAPASKRARCWGDDDDGFRRGDAKKSPSSSGAGWSFAVSFASFSVKNESERGVARKSNEVEGTRDARADVDEHRDERDENDDELDEIARGAVSAWTRAIDDRSAPSAQKKDHQPHFGQTTTLSSSSSFGTGPPPQPSSRKRELTKTTTEQHTKNGRQTAPPIAPKIKLREPPVLAKQPTTAAQRKRDQQVFIREGPSWMKAPSLLTSKATSKKATTTTTTTTMTKSTVFGRQNGAEKLRQETIATSEVKLEKQLKKKIEDSAASPRQKRTLCKEALDDVVRKSNLFRGRLELIRDVIFNDDDENENDENERKNIVKCLVCAENAETIRKLENSLRIEKLERSNVKRDNTDAMKTIAELRADVTQLGKIISRVFRSEIKPRELKEIAAKFLDATSSEKHERIEDDDDEEEEENQWTPLPKTSKFYGLPVEEISWGRTLSPRVMSPGYPVPKLDFSLVTNSVDAEEDGYGSNSTSSSVLSDDSFYDDQEEEEEEEENKDDNDDDDDDNNNNNTEDEDAEVDRWLNS